MSDGGLLERLVPTGLYDTLVAADPKLQRGKVWCTTCGFEQKVDSAHCLRHGWPEHCGATMMVDSPEERRA